MHIIYIFAHGLLVLKLHNNIIYKKLYLQSLDMPTVRHFLNRQYWHRFLFNRITKHLPSLRHRYSICFCILRLKNPWNKHFFDYLYLYLSQCIALRWTKLRSLRYAIYRRYNENKICSYALPLYECYNDR